MSKQDSSANTGTFSKSLFSTNGLRQLVSQKRIRFQDGQYDLDLSYVTPQIIAMGLPATTVKDKLIRNSEDDVSSMLNDYHNSKYLVYNLAQKDYNYKLFNDSVLDCGWPDHHSPPLDRLFDIMNSMAMFLGSCPDNVVAIHCKAGKGRTGTVIVCALVYFGLFKTIPEAMNYFSYRRANSTNKRSGVTIPSQIRYVNYFYDILNGAKVNHSSYLLRSVIIHGCPKKDLRNTVKMFLKIYQENTIPLFSTSDRPVKIDEYSESTKIDLNVVVQGDILIRFKYQAFLKQEDAFRCAFHTGFLGDKTSVVLGKYDLDDAHKNADVPESLSVELCFTRLDDTTTSASSSKVAPTVPAKVKPVLPPRDSINLGPKVPNSPPPQYHDDDDDESQYSDSDDDFEIDTSHMRSAGNGGVIYQPPGGGSVFIGGDESDDDDFHVNVSFAINTRSLKNINLDNIRPDGTIGRTRHIPQSSPAVNTKPKEEEEESADGDDLDDLFRVESQLASPVHADLPQYTSHDIVATFEVEKAIAQAQGVPYEPWKKTIEIRDMYRGLLTTMQYSTETREERKEKKEEAPNMFTKPVAPTPAPAPVQHSASVAPIPSTGSASASPNPVAFQTPPPPANSSVGNVQPVAHPAPLPGGAPPAVPARPPRPPRPTQ